MPPGDNFPPSPQTASVAGAQAAAQAAQTFQLATRAFHLDQLDIEDPSVRRREDPAGEAGQPSPPSPAPRPAEPPPESGFTPEALRRASSAGFTAEEARAFGDPALLERALAAVERVRPRNEPQVSVQPRQPPAPAQPPAPELPSLRDYVYPAGHQYAGEPMFDERLVDVLEAREAALQEQVQALQKQVQVTHQTSQQAWAEQVNARLDAAFAGVPEEYQGAIGAGTYHELHADSPEYRTRLDVYRTLRGIEQSYADAGQAAPPWKTLFDRALAAVCGGQARQVVQQAAAQRQRDANGRYVQQFVAKPTASQNGSAAPPPNERDREEWAVGRLAQRMRGAGMG